MFSFKVSLYLNLAYHHHCTRYLIAFISFSDNLLVWEQDGEVALQDIRQQGDEDPDVGFRRSRQNQYPLHSNIV